MDTSTKSQVDLGLVVRLVLLVKRQKEKMEEVNQERKGQMTQGEQIMMVTGRLSV